MTTKGMARMTNLRRRGAIFDLDGTLADTSADLIGAANVALARMGASGRLDPVADAGVSGQGGRAMLRLGYQRSGITFTEDEINDAYAPFLLDYEGMIADKSALFPGVVPCLDILEGEGWALGVCTNKPERLALLLLDALGVLGRFKAVLGADTLSVKKPNPWHLWETIDRVGADRGASVLIGDTITDRKTAEAAGAPCILMDFGLSADAPHDLAPDAVATSFDQLPGMLRALRPAG
ncbi:MAG: phosphoglycolate phosphatase [Paracoccaceae bacterium]|jgi:phosphoglycolate phosphatase